jgi:hypothetical protein
LHVYYGDIAVKAVRSHFIAKGESDGGAARLYPALKLRSNDSCRRMAITLLIVTEAGSGLNGAEMRSASTGPLRGLSEENTFRIRAFDLPDLEDIH